MDIVFRKIQQPVFTFLILLFSSPSFAVLIEKSGDLFGAAYELSSLLTAGPTARYGGVATAVASNRPNLQYVSAISGVSRLRSDPNLDDIRAEAYARLNYNVTVVAMDSSDVQPFNVPLFFDWVVSSSISSSREPGLGVGTNGYAGVTISAPGYGNFGGEVRHSQGSVILSGKDRVLYKGVPISVDLLTYSRVISPNPGKSAVIEMYADPTVTIDPTWEFADQFRVEYSYYAEGSESLSLEQSDGTVQVPEPSSVSLFLMAIGLLLRRRFS